MPRKQFAKGLFILNDKDGNPLHVGDRVKVTRAEMSFEGAGPPWSDDPNLVELPEEEWKGTLVLLKSKGVAVRTIGGYIQPGLTSMGYAKWTWEKL